MSWAEDGDGEGSEFSEEHYGEVKEGKCCNFLCAVGFEEGRKVAYWLRQTQGEMILAVWYGRPRLAIVSLSLG